MIDDEIRRLIDEAENKAKSVLNEHLDDLHALAKALLEYETLSAHEVEAILRGESIDRPDSGGGAAPQESAGSRSSVPKSGKASKGGKESPGGWEPEPQPGN
jgi:cell division protease FtsH